MNETWQNQPPVADPPPADRWARRPRRSASDRKIAGVAGGLGRALGIDPIILRVAFVVLAVFGGFGVLMYALGWLLLPDERDEASAAEALLGRGRSSVPPVLAVGLGIVVLVSLLSMFSWGLPFWPLVIVGVVAVVMIRRRRYENQPSSHWPVSRHEEQAERHARRFAEHADRWATQASRWGDRAEQWVSRQSWAGPGSSTSPAAGSSPFDRPAFWEQPVPPAKPDLRKHTVDEPQDAPPRPGPAAAAPVQTAEPLDPFGPTRTPPAWDPLGVAPFAWDLPEPTPAPSQPPATTRRPTPITRVTMGLALLAGGLASAGIFAGWWSISWGQVAAISLVVVAAGLLLSSLRGRGLALVGPGVFLALVTLALSVTGISGTEGFGHSKWEPVSVQGVQPSYVINAGYGEVDLSKLTVPAGTTLPVRVELRAGKADIDLPAGTQVNVSCRADAGRVSCLDQDAAGTGKSISATQTGDSSHGVINLDVVVRAGYAEVNGGR